MNRFFLAFALLAALVAGTPARSAETLVIGTVAKDVKDEVREFEPLAVYLEQQLASAGIASVEILILPTAARMAEAFRSGKVDLYIESPFVAAKVARESGAVPMLRRWKQGVGDYWSEIIVRSESPVRTLADLRGRVLAFEDPDSTSGHLLPRALLLENGLDIEVLKRPSDPVSDPQKVGAVFTTSDKSSILWLLDGRVEAIATDPSYVRRVETERPGAIRSIARSISVPRQVVMQSGTMSPDRSRLISTHLLGMADTEDGRRALAAFGKTLRFDRFPAGAEATFAPIHEQLQRLEARQALSASSN